MTAAIENAINNLDNQDDDLDSPDNDFVIPDFEASLLNARFSVNVAFDKERYFDGAECGE